MAAANAESAKGNGNQGPNPKGPKGSEHWCMNRSGCSSTDIVEASAKAYLNALNSYLFAQAAGKSAKKKAKHAAGRQP